MQIYEDSITCLASRGYVTLQVPDVAIGINAPAIVEVPDNWLCVLKSRKRPAIGREDGCVYLTRAGYEANKDELRRVFTAAGGDWSEFESHAAEHFATLERGIEKFRRELQKKLDQLNAFQV